MPDIDEEIKPEIVPEWWKNLKYARWLIRRVTFAAAAVLFFVSLAVNGEDATHMRVTAFGIAAAATVFL